MSLLVFWMAVAIVSAMLMFSVMSSIRAALFTLAGVMVMGGLVYLLFPSQVGTIWSFVILAF